MTHREFGFAILGIAIGVYFGPGLRRLVMGAASSVQEASV